jgi:hypothetical protein
MLPACDALPALVTACALLLLSVPPAPAPAQRPGCSRRSLPLPLARSSSVLSAPDPNTDTRGSTFNPPYTDMLGRHPTSKISPMPFFFSSKTPGRKHPPPDGTQTQKFSYEKFFQDLDDGGHSDKVALVCGVNPKWPKVKSGSRGAQKIEREGIKESWGAGKCR